MRPIQIFIVLCLSLCCKSSDGQIITPYIDELELTMKVKQIDEFFSRFNYEIDYEGHRADAGDTIRMRQSLTTLFDYDTFAKNRLNLDSIAASLLDYVISSNVKLHYEDSTWTAEAQASCTYCGKEYPLSLFMKTEHVRDVIYKWVICDVESSLFKFITDSCNTNISIMPGAHGGSFITVPDFINLNAQSVRSLFRKDYTPSALAVFDFLVGSGGLKMGHVKKVVYHFHTEEYDFTVEQFEKEKTYNKGWLISSITKNKQ